MAAQVAAGFTLYLLTLTAPSEKAHKRWTPAQLYRRGAPRPDCDCHAGVNLAEWNPQAGAIWNRFNTWLVGHYPGRQFYRAAEVQDGKRGGTGRGALHHHVVLALKGAPDVQAIQDAAIAAGYGCVIDLRLVDDLSAVDDVAKYVSKTLAGYVSKSSGDARQAVPWKRDVVDKETGEIRSLHTVPTYNTHSQSQDWGCTIRQLKEHARDQAKKRAAALLSLTHGTPESEETPSVGSVAAGPEPPP